MFRRIERIPRIPVSSKIKEIKKATKDIIQNKRVTEKQYKNRLKTCNDCLYFMKIKASLPSSRCPIDKWSLGDSSIDTTQHEDGCENPN